LSNGTPGGAILEIEDLAYSFGGLKAVNGSTFSIERGGINALIGPNGAGKTTLINVISGALKAEAGRVRFDGTDVTRWPSHKVAGQGLIRTFQISRELAAMTVLENMLVPPPNQAGESLFNAMFRPGVGHRQDRVLVEKALEKLDDFGLYDSRDQYARNLSGGQKRLLELARGVMGEPKLMVLDEPFAGVNPALIELLEGHLQTLQKSGITFVMVEHNLNVVERICDHVVVMAEGKTLATGKLSELRKNEAVITAYLGGALTAHPHAATGGGEVAAHEVSRGEPILTASGLTAGYSKVPVVQGVDLAAEPGKVVAIVGPNGAGKSTMLKAMFGLLRNRSGSVKLARGGDRRLASLQDRPRRDGLCAAGDQRLHQPDHRREPGDGRLHAQIGTGKPGRAGPRDLPRPEGCADQEGGQPEWWPAQHAGHGAGADARAEGGPAR